MREYEILVVTEINDALHQSAKEKVKEILANYKAEVFHEEDFGIHSLAYPISRVSQGKFFFYHFKGEGDSIVQIEKELRYETNILRFIIVRLEEVLDKRVKEEVVVEAKIEESVSN
jgi:small subunit ribosomal protein S6